MSTIVDKREDLKDVTKKLKIAVLFQSTVTYGDYAWAIAELAERCYEFRVLQTVCGVTITRQNRTEKPNLALRHDGFVMAVHELDGIFDGDDMTGLVPVAVIDHRGQRRRLA